VRRPTTQGFVSSAGGEEQIVATPHDSERMGSPTLLALQYPISLLFSCPEGQRRGCVKEDEETASIKGAETALCVREGKTQQVVPEHATVVESPWSHAVCCPCGGDVNRDTSILSLIRDRVVHVLE
jgi:hypothetical protein